MRVYVSPMPDGQDSDSLRLDVEVRDDTVVSHPRPPRRLRAEALAHSLGMAPEDDGGIEAKVEQERAESRSGPGGAPNPQRV